MPNHTNTSVFPIAGEKDFHQHYKKNRWNFSYLDRNLRKIFESSSGKRHAAYAYFDSDGYLLNLYGNREGLSTLKESGFIERMIWTRKTVGRNAVTTGLEKNIAASSVGDQNAFPALKDFAIYFSPVHLLNNSIDTREAKTEMALGGIAAIVPVAFENPDYLMMVAALCHDVSMTLHFNQSTMQLYERENTGLLVVDTSMSKGKSTITYANDTLFKALQIPREDLAFKSLAILLAPEKNEQFWEILNKNCHVTEIPVTLDVRGKRVSCIVSSNTFYQPSINATGIIAFITTPQLESQKISRKMGNTAVLSFSSIIGQSGAIQSAIRKANLIANTDSNVMILGESGVGKDVFAQAIHNASRRKNKPFIAVNCGALPRELIASELFGYDSGAFTGAKKNGNIGKFELANGGTIFLDEIGDLQLDLQATLLRVVEQKQLMRLGSNRLIDVDVKIISATNADLPHMIEQKLFRSDLFFRLSTLKLPLPPLRDRGQDIILLANYFIQSISRRIGREEQMVLSDEAAHLLMTLPWQGNVRELQNLIECIVQLYPEQIILPEHILENITPETSYSVMAGHTYMHSGPASMPPVMGRKKLTREDILNALEKCGGNKSEAAKYLGIARKTLYRNMEKLDL